MGVGGRVVGVGGSGGEHGLAQPKKINIGALQKFKLEGDCTTIALRPPLKYSVAI